MKKVLLPFDGSHFSPGAFEFVRRMNEQSPILLVALFLPEVNYAAMTAYAGTFSGPVFMPVAEPQKETIQKNITLFKDLCVKHHIEFRVHRETEDFALPQLSMETRFADLAVIGSETFYKNLSDSVPNELLKEALHKAECPILLVPEDVEWPASNILAYDGSAAAVFAIRQFAYLFPEWSNNKTVLVYMKEEDTQEVPQEIRIEELAARHFSDLTIFKKEIDPRTYFSSWITHKDRPILISGAFGRSSLSRMFQKSFVSGIIHDHKVPVFIAHR